MKNLPHVWPLLLLFLIPFFGSSQDISGSWSWHAENGNSLMEIILEAEGEEYIGYHCTVFQNGDRIDCAKEDEPASIHIKRTTKNVFEGKIRSAYSASEGKVRMYYDPESQTLLFEILKAPLDLYYLPKIATFKK
ncbi:hypothetical protein [Salinimicrobium oceani]|uniref:Uncharacterized protein n=1 Tax=Salinimicrobium oceani TaxID=2722702 RepID=A0ABX1CWT8_9FLAO|nr:hypothetical protein [Salinimicrobium oceani]NJW52237.1 hypothetical protein [Salinimicrobium oceani]